MDEFECYSGQCVPASVRCDSRFDCEDRTDESECPGRGHGLLFFGEGMVSNDIDLCVQLLQEGAATRTNSTVPAASAY